MRAIVILAVFCTSAVFGQVYEQNHTFRFGVKTSINFSLLTGNKFENPRPRFGYTTGFYFKKRITDHQHFYMEALANFKGSNFNNDSAGHYTKISMFNVDVPLLYAYEFGESGQTLMVGPEVSYYLLSSLYQYQLNKASRTGLNFMPWSVNACLVYQKSNKGASPQFGIKAGITNLNRGIAFDDILPATGMGGIVRSLSFEIGLVF